MAQRRDALSNKANEHLLSGAVRAIMTLRGCDAEEAGAFLDECSAQEMPTTDFYAVLQKLLGSRLLVDKTPIYALHERILARAEEDFDAPLYVHLVRHPGGMIRSFEDAKIAHLVPFMRDSGFSMRQLAELTWLVSNANIDSFFSTIPEDRRFRVRFEDLVRNPEVTARGLCDLLGVSFHPEMLEPYKDQSSRMTDGLNMAAVYSGDLKFHLHQRIEPDAAERWRKFDSDGSLSEMTRELATRFGYS